MRSAGWVRPGSGRCSRPLNSIPETFPANASPRSSCRSPAQTAIPATRWMTVWSPPVARRCSARAAGWCSPPSAGATVPGRRAPAGASGTLPFGSAARTAGPIRTEAYGRARRRPAPPRCSAPARTRPTASAGPPARTAPGVRLGTSEPARTQVFGAGAPAPGPPHPQPPANRTAGVRGAAGPGSPQEPPLAARTQVFGGGWRAPGAAQPPPRRGPRSSAVRVGASPSLRRPSLPGDADAGVRRGGGFRRHRLPREPVRGLRWCGRAVPGRTGPSSHAGRFPATGAPALELPGAEPSRVPRPDRPTRRSGPLPQELRRRRLGRSGRWSAWR
jgi:hypothetical protein